MMFASELHVMPWNIGRLTTEQLDDAVRHFEAIAKAIADAEAKGGAR